jgi:hypothetical protein
VYFAEPVRPYVTVCCGFSLRHCQQRRLLYGTVSTEGYFTELSATKATLRHCRYRRILYGTVGTEGYITALSVSKAIEGYFTALSVSKVIEGYFTALTVPKATLRHCRYRRLPYGTVGTEGYFTALSVPEAIQRRSSVCSILETSLWYSMEAVHIRTSRPTGLNLAFTGDVCFGLYPCRKPSVIKLTHVRCSKPVHSNYYNCTTIKIQV